MMKKTVLILIVLIICIAAAGGVWSIFQRNLSEESSEFTPRSLSEPPLSAAEAALQEMTLEEKVAQLFLVRPEAPRRDATEATAVTVLDEEL